MDVFGAGDAVESGMVDLGQDGERPFREPLHLSEALDDVELPERPGAVQGAGVEPGRRDAELAPVAGLGERDVTDVELEVEVGVLHPVGMIETEGHLDDPLPKVRHPVQTALDVGEDLLERDLAPGGTGLVVDGQGGHVHGCAGCLQGEEGRVETGQLAHEKSPTRD
jgi:hypothetical protein